ncbi:hypothetical protein JXA56_04410 [Candidatus Micrarchaeota archaeon]|nr:hypothetical protein [Candidatus Micrarchaeota archaeon]
MTKKNQAEKKTAKKQDKKETASENKLEITPQLRRNWIRIRQAYNMSLGAFGNALSTLNEQEANQMYNLVINALYKDTVAQIVRDNPKMKDFVKTDEDRFCMYDVYENLSWKLNRKEDPPKYRQVINRFRLAVKKTYIP